MRSLQQAAAYYVGKCAKIPGCSLWIQPTTLGLKCFPRKRRDETGRSRPSLSSLPRPFLVIAVLVANLQSARVALALLISLIAAMVIFALVSADVIRQMRRTERQARTVFEDSEQEFQQMADNIQEIFWVIDAQTKKATYVNPAYETITGRSCQSLMENPSSYEEVIHPEDRVYVLAKLGKAAQTGSFDERFRIVRPDGEIRWVWVRGFPRRDKTGTITRLGGTALDVTALKEAEDQVAANLAQGKLGLGRGRGVAQGNPCSDTRPSHGLCSGRITSFSG
jgi:PAS domain S-box-containing protein